MVDLNPLTPTALVERMARAFGEEDWWALLDVAFPCSRVLQRLARHHLTPSPSDQLIPLPPEAGNESGSSLGSVGMSSSSSGDSLAGARTDTTSESGCPSFRLMETALALVAAIGPRGLRSLLEAAAPGAFALLGDALALLAAETETAAAPRPPLVRDESWILLEEPPSPPVIVPCSPTTPTARTAVEVAASAAQLIHAHATAAPSPDLDTEEFQVFAPAAFRRLARHRPWCPDPLLRPLRSLCTSSRGGALLFQTADEQLVLKRIAPVEHAELVAMADAYVDHLLAAETSVLCTIFGCYGLMERGQLYLFLLMESCFDRHDKLKHLYDLKGSTADRGGAPGARHRCSNAEHRQHHHHCKDRMLARKDNDLCAPLRLLTAGCEDELRAALQRDSEFLMTHGIYDYSLLVAVSEPNPTDGEEDVADQRRGTWPCAGGYVLCARIIDFLTPWSVPVGGGGLRVPTGRSLAYTVTRFLRPGASTLPPAQYQQRFVREVMQKFTSPPPSGCPSPPGSPTPHSAAFNDFPLRVTALSHSDP